MRRVKRNLVIQIFVVFAIFALGAIFINNYFKPVMMFSILMIITLPLDKLMKKNIKNSSIRATISILIINVIVVLLAIVIGGFFYSKIVELMKSGAVNSLNNVKVLLINLENNIKYEQLATKLYSQLTNLSGIILTKGVSFTSSSVSTYFFANIMLFFSIKDREYIINYMDRVLGKELSVFLKRKMLELKEYLKVQVMLVVVSTVQMTIGFMVLGVKDAISYGIVCGLLDILPIVGILLVFIPLILAEIYFGKYLLVFGLVILYLYTAISREILQTKFASKSLNVHPLLLFVSVYVGFKIQGITGAIMLILCSVTLKELIENSTGIQKKWISQ